MISEDENLRAYFLEYFKGIQFSWGHVAAITPRLAFKSEIMLAYGPYTSLQKEHRRTCARGMVDLRLNTLLWSALSAVSFSLLSSHNLSAQLYTPPTEHRTVTVEAGYPKIGVRYEQQLTNHLSWATGLNGRALLGKVSNNVSLYTLHPSFDLGLRWYFSSLEGLEVRETPFRIGAYLGVATGYTYG